MFGWLPLIRIINFAFLFYGIFPETKPLEFQKIAKHNSFPQFIYITQIGLLLSLISISLGLIKYVKDTRMADFKEKIQKIHYFVTINAIGVESIVTFGYWFLFSLNPIYVNNPELYKAGYRRPLLKEISEHVYPFFAIIFEGALLDLKRGSFYYISLGIFGVGYYLASFLVARNHGGAWPYSFLTRLSFFYRISAFAGFIVLAISVIEFFIFIKNRIKERRK